MAPRLMLSEEHPEIDIVAPVPGEGVQMPIHLEVDNVDSVITRALSAGAILVRPAAERAAVFFEAVLGWRLSPRVHRKEGESRATGFTTVSKAAWSPPPCSAAMRSATSRRQRRGFELRAAPPASRVMSPL